MGSDRDDENSLAGMPLSEPKEGLTLPPIAAKADDLEAIRQAVEDAASVGVGLWLSYIFVLFYLAIAAGAVTHADLLLKNPVKLPFLSIELPLLAFFFLAPLLSLIVHAYTLVHFVLLAKKAGRFHNELRKQIPDSSENSKAADIRTALQWQLPSNVFVQFLAGPDDIRDGGFGFLLKTIAWTTLVVGPIALLLLLQIQFLPYHHLGITGTHRVALLADLVLIWWLWRKILGGRGDLRGWLSWKSWAKTVLALVPTAFAVLFSWTIATIPDERQETVEFIFGFNTIVLPRFDIYEALKIGDPKKVDWKKYVIDLRGRHLEHAYLEGATLNRADLTGAFLGGAFLDGSDLQGASLNGAHLQGARLYKAQLQGASLVYAELQGAQLSFAQLQGAELGSAQLQGASLVYAELQGAELSIAQLQGAELFNADLQGASLFGAQLQGASLSEAHLQGASLEGAQLQGASLAVAELQNVSFKGAFLWRADLDLYPPPEGIFAPAATPAADGPNWRPEYRDIDDLSAWTDAAYVALQQTIKRTVPEGERREAALKRVAHLDCQRKDDTLASCDPSIKPPPTVQEWRKEMERASVDEDTYRKALATILDQLVCSGKPDSIHVLRGLVRSKRIKDVGREAPAMIARFMSVACPVSAALTDDDKESLRTIAKKNARKSKDNPAPQGNAAPK